MIDLTELRLMHLAHFYNEAELDFESAIKRLELEYAGTATEAWSLDRGDGSTLTDVFLGDREDVEGLMEMKVPFADY